MSFEEFKKVGNLKPLNLEEKLPLIEQLRSHINDLSPNSITPDIEDAADKLICLCEELLRCSILPNLELLRAYKVDTEALLSRLDAINQGEKVFIGIENGLNDKIIIQIERLILSKLKDGIRQEYKIGCMTKLAAILSHYDNPGRKQEAEKYLKARERFFVEIGDEEGKRFIQSQFQFLPSQFEDYGVETFNGADGEERIHIMCPCCGQSRPCKPFSDVAQIAMISSPEHIPYQGILFCIKCKSLCCGVHATWVRFTERETELADMKSRGIVPDSAGIYSAKCQKSGCDGDLYTLTKSILLKIGEDHA